MRRFAWITALAVATTTSVAIAQPDFDDFDYQRRDQERGWFTRHIPWAYDRDARVYVYDRDRDYPYDRNRYGRYERGRWVPLAEHYSASTDKQSIAVNGRGGRFNRIRVEAVRGAPVIHKIAIEYLGDPNVQAVEMHRRLAPGTGETIRLNGDRRINRIVVYTEPTYRGAYSIYGA
jgi:hypothetical protein